eukprot:jgi/Hompol1/5879/HPOL_000178-RA
MRDAFVRLDNEIVNGAFTTATSTGVGVASVPSSLTSWFSSSNSAYEAAMASLRTAFSGACAIVSYVDGDDIYVASAGDCRAVLGRRVEYTTPKDATKRKVRYEAVQLTQDHGSDNPDEFARVHAEHPGEVVIKYAYGCLRLLGYLMVTRSFGDAIFKWSREDLEAFYPHFKKRRDAPETKTPPYLTAEPVIVHHTRDDNDAFLVLATDGLWESTSSETSARIVGKLIDAQGSDAPTTNAATALVRASLSATNTTVANEERIRHVLSLPARVARHYRDDITVNVLLFGQASSSGSGSEPQQVAPVNLALANVKKPQLAAWRRILAAEDAKQKK